MKMAPFAKLELAFVIFFVVLLIFSIIVNIVL